MILRAAGLPRNDPDSGGDDPFICVKRSSLAVQRPSLQRRHPADTLRLGITACRHVSRLCYSPRQIARWTAMSNHPCAAAGSAYKEPSMRSSEPTLVFETITEADVPELTRVM